MVESEIARVYGDSLAVYQKFDPLLCDWDEVDMPKMANQLWRSLGDTLDTLEPFAEDDVDVDALQGEIDDLHDDLEDYNTSYEDLQTSYDSVSDELADAQQNLDLADSEKAELQEQISSLQDEIDNLNQQLNEATGGDDR